ncbi:MAG TPA: bifunctional adenosylcobinamide kinase/adenosylcobinamide-phosphate guanylyltransferase [Dissulfurispiraceae bacterium]|nr:bifunctional adenosylcobinamide kinase/adenosylcobinamide-phosphate guanylyltransferase [Dissulfurispiraceae bacterium]
MSGGKITFILGGARSGKSGFALKCASELNGSKAFIATAQAFDDEMRDRIEQHKKERPVEWKTFESPLLIPKLISDVGTRYGVVLVDCLTLWLSNLLMNEVDIEAVIESLLLSAAHCPAALFIVSNEVGMGIVPENALARRFRDLAGTLNRRTAEIADEVYLVVAGIPVKIK